MLGFMLLLLLFLVTGSSNAHDPGNPESKLCPDIGFYQGNHASTQNSITGRAMWDILLYFETTASSQSGVVTDGNYIYTASFSTPLFRKFEMDGTFVEEFTITGVTSVNCMTFDGTNFYGAQGNLGNGIYILDLADHSLLNTIPVSAPSIIGIGHISYDPELDSGSGGFWTGYWHELAAVDMNGNQIIANLWTGGASLSCAGSCYDAVTDPADPCLYLFRQSGSSKQEISRFDINSRTFEPAILHVTTDIPGPAGGSTSSVASGMNSFVNRNSKLVMLGMIDCFPGNEMIFEYEISDAFVYSNDIGMQSLVSPVTGDTLTSTENVTVSILNNGTVPQSNFNIQYTIDDGTGAAGPFVQTVSQTVAPGETYDFTFNETADLSSPGNEYTITVISSLSGDENPANDTLTKVVVNTSNLYGPGSGGGPEHISNVQIGGISNPSGSDYYADYSAEPSLYIYLEEGNPEQFTMTIGQGYNADIGAVWIDWNLDYDFTADERVFLSSFGPGPYTCSITAPGDAVMNQNLRMRLRLDYNNTNPQPYGTTSFGEVEDYTVIVNQTGIAGDNPLLPATGNLCIYPNPSSGSSTVSFHLSKAEQIRIDLFDLNGRMIETVFESDYSIQHQTDLEMGHLPSGIYICRLKTASFEISRRVLLLD